MLCPGKSSFKRGDVTTVMLSSKIFSTQFCPDNVADTVPVASCVRSLKKSDFYHKIIVDSN